MKVIKLEVTIAIDGDNDSEIPEVIDDLILSNDGWFDHFGITETAIKKVKSKTVECKSFSEMLEENEQYGADDWYIEALRQIKLINS